MHNDIMEKRTSKKSKTRQGRPKLRDDHRRQRVCVSLDSGLLSVVDSIAMHRGASRSSVVANLVTLGVGFMRDEREAREVSLSDLHDLAERGAFGE